MRSDLFSVGFDFLGYWMKTDTGRFGVGSLAHFRQVIIDADKGQGGTVLQDPSS